MTQQLKGKVSASGIATENNVKRINVYLIDEVMVGLCELLELHGILRGGERPYSRKKTDAG
jgi:hypothetical protein